MKKVFLCTIGALATCFITGAQAETKQVSSTVHWVMMDRGQPVEMPNGTKGMQTMKVHGTVVQADGSTSSQWCTGHQGVSASGKGGGAGYCSIIYDNGDMMYIGFRITGPDQKGNWVVLGGTGEYEGATGSGTSMTVSRRSDGSAWTSESRGTITTM